jgi:hypothetical protein
MSKHQLTHSISLSPIYEPDLFDAIDSSELTLQILGPLRGSPSGILQVTFRVGVLSLPAAPMGIASSAIALIAASHILVLERFANHMPHPLACAPTSQVTRELRFTSGGRLISEFLCSVPAALFKASPVPPRSAPFTQSLTCSPLGTVGVDLCRCR